ncbi:hypothetical protein Taro_052685 [Colocasia esculenta]|uniref:Uncharacterized protein n=1 Tax=Colocasia esculenta TaxID=4460 RepID=A0A843XKY4_COLES|nr:hypothetical protein [Colocasia esculenta]
MKESDQSLETEEAPEDEDVSTHHNIRSTHFTLVPTQFDLRSTHFTLVSTQPHSVAGSGLDFTAPKQTPRRGAKARAASKGVVIQERPMEQWSKYRNDPSNRKPDSIPSGTPSKYSKTTPQDEGKSVMPSRYPKRQILRDSSSSEESSSSSAEGTPSFNPNTEPPEVSSSDASQSSAATPLRSVQSERKRWCDVSGVDTTLLEYRHKAQFQ